MEGGDPGRGHQAHAMKGSLSAVAIHAANGAEQTRFHALGLMRMNLVKRRQLALTTFHCSIACRVMKLRKT